jgi:hypothetical protein
MQAMMTMSHFGFLKAALYPLSKSGTGTLSMLY